MARRLALIIGNSVYQDKTLERLKTPDADVGALYDVLKDSDLGGFDDVKLLVNVTSTTVRRAISEFFSQKARDDLLLLYFTGHGVLDDRGRLYLAVKNTNRDYLRASAILAGFITDEMDSSRSQRQLLILDCCHSGAFARGTKGVTGASVGTATAFEGTGYGRVVLTATDATQYAWEGDQILGEAQTSLYTHYLIKGLQSGAADINGDGKITVDELYDYIYEQIVKQTPKQTPGKWSYKEQGEIIIALSQPEESQPEVALPMPEQDEELERRLEKLYIDGLSAFWLEEWERTIRNFQAIADVRPDYKDAPAKLKEAQQQKQRQELYAKAQTAQESNNWGEALAALETLVSEAGEYRDSKTMLEGVKQKKRLSDLYAEALDLHQAEKWQAVVNIFAQITAINPDYPDPESLLASAKQKTAELERQEQLEDLYRQALLEMDAGRWESAQQLLSQVEGMEPGYQETVHLLSRVNAKLEREQAERQRQEQIATLYAQARRLALSRQWRQVQQIMEEIRGLDPEFPDPEGIVDKAQSELEREKQEAQRQNELDALYDEAVNLLQVGSYQEALEKWVQVQKRAPRYPDHQKVQSTARKKLSAVGKKTLFENLWTPRALVISFFVVLIVGLGMYLLISSLRPDERLVTSAQATDFRLTPPTESPPTAQATDFRPTPPTESPPTPPRETAGALLIATSTPEPRSLVICVGQEPDTLYPLREVFTEQSNILEAVYDGPIDNRTYAFQPVILEKLPSLADGDAILRTVTVSEGDMIVDANESLTTLSTGTLVTPSGVTEPIEFAGGSIQLDQLEVTFRLLPDIKWSDGTPLTAVDSVYAFNLIDLDPDTTLSTFTIQRTASYKALDDLTVKWIGLPGFKDSDYYLNFWGPYPQHIWGEHTPTELTDAEVSAEKPMGWGPYVIQEWARGEYVKLTPNPNYFRGPEGLPVFSELVFRFVGQDGNANIAALLAGECDIVDQSGDLDDEINLILELQTSDQLQAQIGTRNLWEHMDFGIQHINYDDGYDGGIQDRPNFFGDVRTRRAIAHCLDRQAVVDTALYGMSIIPDTYVPPDHPLLNPNVASYEFNPERGRALLEEVGWRDTDGDGFLEAASVLGIPVGTEFRVSYETTTDTLRQQVAPILADLLAQCGIQVDLNFYPASEWFANGPEGKLFGRKFDLGTFAWLTDRVEPPCDLYLSANVPGPEDDMWTPIMNPAAGPLTFRDWNERNETGYFSPEYDQACLSARSALPGQPGYVEKHLAALEIFAEDLPVVPLYMRLKPAAAARRDMCNFIRDPTEYIVN